MSFGFPRSGVRQALLVCIFVLAAFSAREASANSPRRQRLPTRYQSRCEAILRKDHAEFEALRRWAVARQRQGIPVQGRSELPAERDRNVPRSLARERRMLVSNGRDLFDYERNLDDPFRVTLGSWMRPEVALAAPDRFWLDLGGGAQISRAQAEFLQENITGWPQPRMRSTHEPLSASSARRIESHDGKASIITDCFGLLPHSLAPDDYFLRVGRLLRGEGRYFGVFPSRTRLLDPAGREISWLSWFRAFEGLEFIGQTERVHGPELILSGRAISLLRTTGRVRVPPLRLVHYEPPRQGESAALRVFQLAL